MATRRMLHNKISLSLQVNKLPLEAQLLFTWMISHADDEGRLKGEPEYVKATVVPLKEWSVDMVSNYLDEIQKQKLINYWDDGNRKIIEFISWKDHQSIRKDRFQPSKLTSFIEEMNGKTTNCLPDVNQVTAQHNTKEFSFNKKEENKNKNSESCKSIISKNKERVISDSGNLNRHQSAAYFAWKKLEPNNKDSLFTTYLRAVKLGIKDEVIYRFVSEISADKSIKNPGKVFNFKVDEYCKIKEDDKS